MQKCLLFWKVLFTPSLLHLSLSSFIRVHLEQEAATDFPATG